MAGLGTLHALPFSVKHLLIISFYIFRGDCLLKIKD